MHTSTLLKHENQLNHQRFSKHDTNSGAWAHRNIFETLRTETSQHKIKTVVYISTAPLYIWTLHTLYISKQLAHTKITAVVHITEWSCPHKEAPGTHHTDTQI